MRLFRRHVYRAIPELDAFSDDACRRIIARVYRLKPLQIGAATLAAAIFFLPVAMLVAWIFLYILTAVLALGATLKLDRLVHGDVVIFFAVVIVISIVVGLPALVAFSVRNHMLSLGCQRLLVLNDRCIACSYPFTGLRAAPGQALRCPECGADSQLPPPL